MQAMQFLVDASVLSRNNFCKAGARPESLNALNALCRSQVPHGGMRLHISHAAIKALKPNNNSTSTRVINSDDDEIHATGLWYAFDADWIDYKKNGRPAPVGRFAYDVQLIRGCLTTDLETHDPDNKVLVLRDWSDLKRFHDKFMRNVPEGGDYWKEVKKHFAGYEIRFTPPGQAFLEDEMTKHPFITDKLQLHQVLASGALLPHQMIWLDHMRIRSGCIWNVQRVVTSMQELPLLASLLFGPQVTPSVLAPPLLPSSLSNAARPLPMTSSPKKSNKGRSKSKFSKK